EIGAVVRWDDVRGVVASLRGPLERIAERRTTPQATVLAFLDAFGALFGPERLTAVLRPLRARTHQRGWTHLEYVQTPPARGRPRGRPGGGRRGRGRGAVGRGARPRAGGAPEDHGRRAWPAPDPPRDPRPGVSGGRAPHAPPAPISADAPAAAGRVPLAGRLSP